MTFTLPKPVKQNPVKPLTIWSFYRKVNNRWTRISHASYVNLALAFKVWENRIALGQQEIRPVRSLHSLTEVR